MPHRLWELARLFLKLGTVSFGGPAVHIATMQHEVCDRRGWLSREEFLDLIGATYLIPGPNAVEMASHVGFRRAGVLGSIVAGLAFSFPAVTIAAVLAWSYARYGARPQVEPFLKGINPVVLGIMFAAVVRLGRTGLKSWRLGVIAAAVAAASLAGYDPVWSLLAGGVLGALFLHIRRRENGTGAKNAAGTVACVASAGWAARAKAASAVAASAGAVSAGGAAAVSLWKLGLFFLKVGLVFYGGGYVLVAYMEGGLVGDYGWLSREQLVEAVAIGQITPGPMLSSITFVGYLVAGLPGAAVATAAILLPSFFFVAAANPLIPRLRRSYTAGLFLDSVSAAAIGLMAIVSVKLSQTALVDAVGWTLAIVAALIALRFKIAPIWLVLGGAAAGWMLF